jgi:hypothetical protein
MVNCSKIKESKSCITCVFMRKYGQKSYDWNCRLDVQGHDTNGWANDANKQVCDFHHTIEEMIKKLEVR